MIGKTKIIFILADLLMFSEICYRCLKVVFFFVCLTECVLLWIMPHCWNSVCILLISLERFGVCRSNSDNLSLTRNILPSLYLNFETFHHFGHVAFSSNVFKFKTILFPNLSCPNFNFITCVKINIWSNKLHKR